MNTNRTILVFLFFLLITAGLFAGGGQEKIPGEDIKATVSYIEGTVLINGKTADFGDPVPVGSTVETKPSSLCEILFGEQNIFRIEPDTITTISIGPENREIDLQTGAIGAVFGKLEKLGGTDREFVISSPSVVAGVRGTVFYAKVEDPNTVYFCTCHGSIRQYNGTGTVDETISADHHKAYRYQRTEDGTEVTQGQLLYHNDSYMDEIAKKAGLSIPWNELNKGY